MVANRDPFRSQLSSYFSNLTVKQKLGFFISVVLGLALIFVLVTWATKPSYDILFTNLSQKDAGTIVEKLQEKKVNYRLENGGTTILVPREKVYELRLAFAQAGLPESSGVGYEIFDKTSIGMTDFLQQLNYRRALEGELARTIEQIDVVERARVHIVIPKESLFQEDQKEATASVILKLRGGTRPSKSVVQGVCHLIASSVEGMRPENITVLDTQGRVLSDNRDPNDLVSLSATQLEYSNQVEQYLMQKAQTMLDQVVGPGNSVVRLTAQLDFTQVEKSIEEYDPENTAIRSEEIVEESTPLNSENGGSGSSRPPSSKSSSTITNYEINKTVQRIVEGVGNIQRLSVAVMVNNKKQINKTDDGSVSVQYIPRSPEEMELLADLVRKAVGFQPDRGDQISVVNVDFSVPSGGNLLDTEETPLWNNLYEVIEKVFLFLAIIAAMLIMRSLFSQVRKRNEEIQMQIKFLKQEFSRPELTAGLGEKSKPGQISSPTNQPEVVSAENFFKSIPTSDPLSSSMQAYVKEKPDETARLIKVWLTDENES
ncbi:MAG: flagellar basal-body MS-ring/collar protein FliF [Calditrichia bacterium]